MRIDGPVGEIHDEIGGVDSEGFIPRARLAAIAKETPVAAFAKHYPAPALHIFALGSIEETAMLKLTEQEISFQRTMALPLHGDARRYHDRIAFLVKRPNGPFPNMVSLGRALNSDVVVALETLSKFHGYFMKQGAQWSYVDGKTTNGTHVNGERLAPGAKRLLAEGDELTFGLEIRAKIFLAPAKLHASLLAG